MQIRISAAIAPGGFGGGEVASVRHEETIVGFMTTFPPTAEELTEMQAAAIQVAFEDAWVEAGERMRRKLQTLAHDVGNRVEKAERAELELLRRNPTNLQYGEEEQARLEELEEKWGNPAGSIVQPPRELEASTALWRPVLLEDGRVAEELPAELGLPGVGGLVLYPQPREMVAAVRVDLSTGAFFTRERWEEMVDAGEARYLEGEEAERLATA